MDFRIRKDTQKAYEEALKEILVKLDIDPQQLGIYLKEKADEDHGLNDLLKPADPMKPQYYDRKTLLRSIQYFAHILNN